MNRAKTAEQIEAATDTPAEDQPEQQPVAEQQPSQRVALLSSMTTSPVIGSGMVAFLPRDMMQAIEFSKMMAAGNFVPPHLRNKPGDCLAVVLQAIRWRADPFAVAGKTYFVNDRMAYEAQMVNAVLNTSTVLDGRLQISWQGSIGKIDFQCTVKGRIKGDEEVHELIQERSTITKTNSPLWTVSPRVQLGYFTSRAWGRLYTPEVMLGIYTPDEIEDGTGHDAPVIGQQLAGSVTYSIPPRPTRESVKAEKEAVERVRKEQVANQGHARNIAREVPHDKATGEVIEHDAGEAQADAQPQSTQAADAQPEAAADPATADTTATSTESPHRKFADEFLSRLAKAGSLKVMNEFVAKHGDRLNQIDGEGDAIYAELQAAITARKEQFAR